MTTLPSKEAVVIILDVGNSMVEGGTAKLEGAVKAVNLLIQQKLLYSPKDEIGLVLFGTKETKNQLSEIGYEHISVVREIQPPDLDLVRLIEKITPGGSAGDFIDALIVGMGLLIQKKGKFSHRIFLVTDAGSNVNTDDFPKVAQQFETMEVRLNIIGVDFDEEDAGPKEGKPKIKMANEKLLYAFAKKVNGAVVAVHQALEMMSYFRSRTVLQRTSFRGFLEIGPDVKVGVWSFMKTMEAKFPSLQKVSVVSQESANPASMGVKLERTYQNLADPDQEIAADDRVKAFRYGKTLVPFSKADESVLNYACPERTFVLIGFTNVKNVPRHHFMGNIECFVPIPGDATGSTALSALIHALFETESVGIVRYVKRANSIPHLGAILPHIKADMECLYYTKLPFAEDLRQYAFAPLSLGHIKKSFAPSKDQLAAAEALIHSLDLTKAAENDDGEPMEALKPKHTYNPVLQRFYQCVQKRAMNPDAALPKLDPVIAKYVNPDQELFEKAEAAFAQVAEAFPLTKTDHKEKVSRKYWKDQLAEAGDIRLESYATEGGTQKKQKKDADAAGFNMDAIISAGVSEVGSVRPVQDFKNMIARRDVDLVDKAIEQMRARILQLVNDSVRDQLYPKALECLRALREGALQEGESDVFNKFLREMRSFYERKRRDDFWKQVVAAKLSLIHYDETPDSPISPEEAAEFLSGAPVAEVAPASSEPKRSGDEAENLFEQAE